MTALAEPELVRRLLVAAAGAGVALTYSELLEQLGYSFSRPKMRQLCSILAVVDEQAQDLGEPGLAVLVVRQSDGIPGQGWWVGGGARARGYTGPWQGPEAKRFIEMVQSEAFTFWTSMNGTDPASRKD